MILTEDRHWITGNELDVSCSCGWYDNDPRDTAVDKTATAHILRNVAHLSDLADEYEADYRLWMGVPL